MKVKAPPQSHRTAFQIKIVEADSLLQHLRLPEAIEAFQNIIAAIQSSSNQLDNVGDSINRYILCDKQLIVNEQAKIYQGNGFNLSVYDKLLLCYILTQNYEQAERYYRQKLKKNSSNTNFLIGMACIYFHQGEYQQSKRALKEILRLRPGDKESMRYLAMMAFYENSKEALNYLDKIGQINCKDYPLLSITAFLKQSVEDRRFYLNRILENYPNYRRALLLKVVLLLQINDQKEAIQSLMQYSKQNPINTSISLQLAIIYQSKDESQKSIACLQKAKATKEKIDVYLINYYLAFLYLKESKYDLAEKNAVSALFQIQNKSLSLNKSTFVFLKSQIKKIEELSISMKTKKVTDMTLWKTLKKIDNLIKKLYSANQEHINARVTRIINDQLEVLSCLHQIVDQNFRFNNNIIKFIHSLEIGSQFQIQFLSLAISQFFKQTLSQKQFTINQIQDIISNAVAQFKSLSSKQEQIIQDEEVTEQNQKIYTIKYSNKVYNSLPGQEYFSSYNHLFTAVKKFGKNVKIAALPVENIVLNILQKFSPTDVSLKLKLDQANLDISIDQIIVEMLPELTQYRQSLWSDSLKNLTDFSEFSLPNLIQQIREQLHMAIQSSLKRRQERKQPLLFVINNWIQVDLLFSQQKKIINSIQFLEQESKNQEFQIIKVEACLKSQYGISIQIKIHQVCCKMNFYLQKQQEHILFQKQLEKMINYKLGCCLFSLFNINKSRKQSVISHFEQLLSYPRIQDHLFDLPTIKRFLEEMRPKEYLDHQSSFEKSFTKNKTVISKDINRERDKVKTLIIGMQNRPVHQQTVFLTEQNSTSRTRKLSFDESDETSQRQTANKSHLKPTQIRFQGETGKKQKHRFKTQENEALIEGASFSTINRKFDEADIEDNASDHKNQANTICKSIQISISACKIQQNSEQNSKTTQGQCQNAILRQKILQLQEAVTQLSQQKNQLLIQLIGEQKNQQEITRLQAIQAKQNNQHLKQINALKEEMNSFKEEKQKLKENERKLMEKMIEKQQYQKVRHSESMLKVKVNELKKQIQDQRNVQQQLKEQIHSLKQRQQMLKVGSTNNIKIQELFMRQFAAIKMEIDQNKGNQLEIKAMVTNIQKQLKLIKNQLQKNQQLAMVEKEPLIKNSIAVQCQIDQQQQQKLKKKIQKNYATLFTQTEIDQQISEQQSQKQRMQLQNCANCEIEREKVLKLNKKLEYTTLIFIILIFEAITFSFSTYILN